MRFPILFFLLLCGALSLKAQFIQLHKPSPIEQADAPDWARLMYSDTAKVALVDDLYSIWNREHPGEKNYHTQYYKRWHRMAAMCLDEQGYLDLLESDSYMRTGIFVVQ